MTASPQQTRRRPMTLSSSLTRLAVGTIAAAGLWLSAADVTQAQELSTMNLNVDEGGSNAYSISLDTQPTGTVTITPIVVPIYHQNVPIDTGVTVSGAVTFTTADWETPRAITVTAADNDRDAGNITVTITHAVDGYGSISSAGDVVVTVFDNDGDTAPTFGSIAPPRQLYAPGIDTPTLTLPAAYGGNKPLAYTLTPVADIPDGLTVDTTARTLAGTPTSMAAAVTLTWTVTDTDTNTADSDQDMLSVILDVQTDTAPNFGGAMVAAQVYLQHVAAVLTLPEADGGNGALTYALIGNIPAGLAFNLDTRVLAGIPTTAVAATTLTWTVTDADTNTANSDTASLTVTITVTANPSPSFDAMPVVTQTYVSGQAIDPLTLPAAVGNNGPFSYALTGTVPAGLAYTDATRTIAGTPTATGTTTLTWSATDSGSRTTTLSFTIVVHPTSVCLRTPVVRDYIVRNVSGATSCDAVTVAGLRAIESVEIQGTPENPISLPIVRSGDFDGFSTQANRFILDNVGLTTVPADMFRGLRALQTIRLINNDTLTTLPTGLFNGQTQVQTIDLQNNRLDTLPPGLFDTHNSLTQLHLQNNRLRTLPTGVFVRLRNLEQLLLFGNLLTTLPGGIFSEIGPAGSGLTIRLDRNRLETLPATVFSGLGGRVGTLNMIYNQIEILPEGLFDGLTGLSQVALAFNPSVPFPLEVRIVRDEGSSQYRAHIREAAPLAINFGWSQVGTAGGNGMIPAGSRMSDPFGTTASRPELTSVAFASGIHNGLDLRISLEGVFVEPGTRSVDEGNMGTYTVVLGTAPTGDVTVTSSISPDDDTHTLDVVSSRTLIYTPANWHLSQTVTITTAVDEDGDNETVTITHAGSGISTGINNNIVITVRDIDSRPSFGMAMVPDQTYPAGVLIPVLTLPSVMGGDDTPTYVLNGLPDGLTFNNVSLEMSGTPTVLGAGQHALTYSVTDSDNNTSEDDMATLTFTVTITTEPRVTLAPTALTVQEGTDTTSFYTAVLNSVPTGEVTVTPADATGKVTVSGALTFSAATWSVRQTVTVSAVDDPDNTDDTITIVHTVTGYGDVTSAEEDVTVSIIDRRSAPTFSLATVDDQFYTVGTAIPTLTLPRATRGDNLVHTLDGDLPDGLTFNPDALTLTGTPTTPTPAVTLTWTVTDTDTNTSPEDSASLNFAVTVEAMARVIIEPTALTVEEGSTIAASYTVVLSTMPTGAVTVAPRVGAGGGLTVSGALTFAAAAWSTLQTVTVSAPADPAATAARSTVIDHDVSGYGGVTAPGVTVTITIQHRVPSFGSSTVPDQRYRVNAAIPPLTLPAATGGNGSLRHILTGSIPTGLTWNEADRTLTGVPTTVDTTGVTLTYTVTDADANTAADDTDTLTFAVMVDRVPAVIINPSALTVEEGSTTVYYTVVLTTTPDGDVTVTPTVSDRAKLTLTGTPTLSFSAANWSTMQTITVSGTLDYDADNETVTITHAVVGYGTVTAGSVTVTVTDVNSAPDFGAMAVADQTYIQGMVIPTLALPRATSGNGDLVHTLTGAVPDGLTFNADTLTLTGSPTNVAPAVTLTYTVTDDDTDRDPEDTASLIFAVTIALAPAITVTPTALTVNEGGMDTYTVVLITMPDAQVIVTPTPDSNRVTISGALTFSPTTWSTEQTVTVAADLDDDTANEAVTIGHTVSGYGGVMAAPVSVVVNDVNGVPAFDVTVADQTYTERTPISTLTLPTGSGGDGALSYTLTGPLPAGLTFIPASRTLVGCPVVVTSVTLTYRVSDTDTNAAGDEGMQTFTVTVNAGNPSVTLSTDAITMAEGARATYTMVLTTKPVDEAIITPTVGDSARLVTSGALTFTTANWLTARTVTVTSRVDRDAANDVIAITHAAVGYGATIDDVAITVTDNDNAPDFGGTTVPPRIYTVDIPTFAPVALTLPEATGGNGNRVYALAPLPLPAGLSYAASTRTLTVTAPLVQSLVLTWTVSDADTNTAAEDEDVLTFPLTVNVVPRVIVAPTSLTVEEGSEGAYTLVLSTNPGGPVTVTPTISDRTRLTGPGVLSFGTANWDVVQTVTVVSVTEDDMADDTVTIGHVVAGYVGVADVADVVVRIPDTNSAPTFGVATVPDQTYTINTLITALTLPRAMAGDGTLRYALTPVEDIPAGLTLTAGVYTLSGTPTLVAPEVVLTWAVTDVDNQRAFLTFTVLVKSDLDAIIARRNRINRVILPEVARALADQGMGAISERIRQAGSDAARDRRVTVGGQSTFAGALTSHGRALIEGRFDLKSVLAGSDFVLPLNAREVVPGTGISALSVWGGGDYRRLSGNGDAIDWEGGLFSARLGADARLRDDLLAGVAVSWGDVDLNYNYTGEGSGDYEVGLTTVYPYLGWTALSGRLDVWATAGYGWGELEITEDEAEDDDDLVSRRASSDVTVTTVGAGGSARVLEGHGALVRIKGEALQTVMDVDGSRGIASMAVEARRMRVSVEASHVRQIEGWGEFVPSVEVGMRHDAGDGRTGTGAEVGGRVRYTDVASGLVIESHGRVLLGHGGGYEDWGIGGSVRLDAGGGGRGLSFGLRPIWGATASRVSQVWAQEAAATVASTAGSGPRNGRVDLDLGYGVGWGEGGGSVLVTPYGQMSLTNGPVRSWRLGGRMRLGSGFNLNLEGTRQERADRLTDHGILLKIGLSF